MPCHIGAVIFDRRLCTATIPNNDVAVTTGLVVLRPLSVALRGVGLGPLDLGGESLKVGVAAACGSSGRQACFHLLSAYPPARPSGRSRGSLACGLLIQA